MDYGWLITNDYLYTEFVDLEEIAVGTTGPHNITQSKVIDLTERMKPYARFRMYDDDGILYYEGVIMPNPLEGEELTGFEPLDDFGLPDSGCTEIRYYDNTARKWVTL